uniref:EF-hand domain-containing protein n=1 Tax=Cynoglossus semilaevis TaxID=244447 RepID=A0A3P8URH7_CYNSE
MNYFKPSTQDGNDIEALQKKIRATFKTFDYSSDDTVDIRAVGQIFYLLGCIPSQKEIKQFVAGVKDKHMDYVHLEVFLPAMTQVLLENKFPSIPEHALLQAFQILDRDKKGYLDSKELTDYMTKQGDVLTEDEMAGMLKLFAENKDERLYYKDEQKRARVMRPSLYWIAQ